MPKRSRASDAPGPDDWLCESCGYPLAGLPMSGACPECGQSCGASDPRGRLGSPAQRPGAGLKGWWTTNTGVLHPMGRGWAGILVDPGRSTKLLVTNLALGGLIGGLALKLPAPMHPNGASWAYSLTFAFGLAMVMAFLAYVESIGIRFFGSRRGWRVSRGVAGAVCAHSSVGWIVAGVLLALGWHVGQRLPQREWFNLPVPPNGLPVTPTWVVPVLGFFAGLVVFELLVYEGVRRLRFANHSGVALGAS